MRATAVAGRGLGLRRGLLGQLEAYAGGGIDFLEAAPENWIDIGGAPGRRFRALTGRWPLVCHGLSLNLGGLAPLDEAFIERLREFLEQHAVAGYSEHLSYCADDGQLYDLLPIPFTRDAVAHVAARIARVQDLLGRRIAVENVSYYCAPGAEMKEQEFIRAVIEQADCDLLLDVNNVYVNSVNHGYDPRAFLDALPATRVVALHVAGHRREAADLLVDSHGAAVVAPVWELLDEAYARFGALPTVLERDFDLPPLEALLAELDTVGRLQAADRTVAHA